MDEATTAKITQRDHPLLSRSSGGRTPCGWTLAIRVYSHEGGSPSIPATPRQLPFSISGARPVPTPFGWPREDIKCTSSTPCPASWKRPGVGEASPNRIWTCQVGDARELTFNDGVADGVLLLGPLYHLTDAPERRRALRETYRVLRPGGVMFAAAISRCASTLDGVARRRPLFRGDCAARPRARTTPKRDGQLGLLHHWLREIEADDRK